MTQFYGDGGAFLSGLFFFFGMYQIGDGSLSGWDPVNRSFRWHSRFWSFGHQSLDPPLTKYTVLYSLSWYFEEFSLVLVGLRQLGIGHGGADATPVENR
jgi:hypothetical protein